VELAQRVDAVQARLVELEQIDARLDEVGDDGGDLAAGVHEHSEAMVVRHIAEPHETRLEHLPPGGRADHEALLGAPVLWEHDGVHAGGCVLNHCLG